MAFSTQKDFFHVPFMNQTMEFECRRACVKLKSYESTIDDRSWAMDEAEPSRFLYDLVKCNTPITGYETDEEAPSSSSANREKVRETGRPGDGGGKGGGGKGGGGGSSGSGGGSGATGSPAGGSPSGTGSSGAGPSGAGSSNAGPSDNASNSGKGGPSDGQTKSSPDDDRKTADSAGKKEPSNGTDQTPSKMSYTKTGSTSHDVGSQNINHDLYGQLKGADSVLECANKNLSILHELLNDKKDLQQKLEVSNERLLTAKEENEKIKNIMGQKFDTSHSKDFHNKIQKLASSGKISKSEENELLNTFYKVEDMYMSYEVIQAENSFLKRLSEKLSQRATLNSIKSEAETSTDIQYLQNEVNSMRKELILLRKTEDDRLRSNQDESKARVLADQDAARLKAIMEERNALREKCKSFKDLEKKIRELQRKANEADNISNGLSKDLDNQTSYISNMENEMQRMQKYYEDEMHKLKYNEELLKCQMQELKEELCRANCKAQKADCLQMEIGCLRNELLKRELALGDYDCQYKQLMFVVEELRNQNSVEIQNLQDTQTQTCNDNVEDLAFFASATLTEIMKELNRRGISPSGGHIPKKGDGDSVQQGDPNKEKRDSYLDNKEARGSINVDKIEDIDQCKDLLQNALNDLKKLEDKYMDCKQNAASIKAENDRLNNNLTEKEKKLNELSKKCNELDKEIGEQGKNTDQVGNDLRESLDLLQDIKEVQDKNNQIKKEVDAIQSRDDKKLIDDLRKQLQECKDQNDRLRKEIEDCRKKLKDRGISPPRVSIIKPGEGSRGSVVKVGGGTVKEGSSGPQGGGVTKDKDVKPGRPDKTAKPDEEGKTGQGGKPGDGGKTDGGKTDGGKTDGGKTDGGKTDGGKTDGGKADGGKTDGGKTDGGKTGTGKTDGVKTDGGKTDGGKTDGGKTDGGKTDGGKTGTGKTDGGKTDGGKTDGGKTDGGKTDGGKTDGGKPGTGKTDGGKTDGGKTDGGKTDGGKTDGGKTDSGKTDGGKTDGGKTDGGKPGSEKTDDGKTDGGKTDDGKTDGGKAGTGKTDGGKTDDGNAGTGKTDGGKTDGGKTDDGKTDGGNDKIGPSGEKPESGSADKTDAGGAHVGAAENDKKGVEGAPQKTTEVGEAMSTNRDKSDSAYPDEHSEASGEEIGSDGKPVSHPGGKPGGGGKGRIDKVGPSSATRRPDGEPGKDGKQSGGKGAMAGGRPGKDKTPDSVCEEFIKQNLPNVSNNLKIGHTLEHELKKILEDFISECGYSLCRCSLPKSKFYAICHKILHNGINTLSFREIAYLHKKLFIAAEKLHPGCLLSMILADQYGMQQDNGEDKRLKCCTCKNTLCCINSEEMLKEKVYKLERDIEKAKEYLDHFKTRPQQTYRKSCNREDSTCELDRPISQRSNQPANISKCNSKQLRHLKARILKCSDILR